MGPHARSHGAQAEETFVVCLVRARRANLIEYAQRAPDLSDQRRDRDPRNAHDACQSRKNCPLRLSLHSRPMTRASSESIVLFDENSFDILGLSYDDGGM